MSPDLTGYVEKEVKEGEKTDPGQEHPPAITALSLSPLQANVMWVGTSNRLVQLTRDGGKSWQNVTPPDLAAPAEILYVEASHHDAASAYLTAGGSRESIPPMVFRTHDSGKTWQKIVNGFPGDEGVRVVREDPVRKGLLYAGTDTTVFASWDDGDHWQPLTLNLPPAPVTDLTVHGNDVVISTFGRSFWILDDVSPLRGMNPQIMAANAQLLSPAMAMRVRWDNYEDTPFPPETPAGQNPPDGAIIDYYLKNAPSGELTLTVYDDKGDVVASYSSDPKPFEIPPANAPEYWFAHPAALTKSAGVNRFVWDLRYPAPRTLPYGYFGALLGYTEYTLADHAVPSDTPRLQPQGPLVVPGKYTLELSYGGKTYKQPLTLELDPRVRTSQQNLVDQRDVALSAGRGITASYDAFHAAAALREALASSQKSVDRPEIKQAADAISKQLDAVQNGTKTAPGFGPVNRELARLIFSVESADIRPADTVRAAIQQSCDALDKDLTQWQQLNAKDVAAFNALLPAGTTPLPMTKMTTSGCKP